MFHVLKDTNVLIKRTSLLSGFLFAALAILPISALAQCKSWDAGGIMSIIQRGQPYPMRLSLVQKGRVITGVGYVEMNLDKFLSFNTRKVSGTVDGTLDGDSFSIQIFWPDGLTGVYNGKVLPSGRLDGETYDKNNSKIRQTWHTENVLTCLPAPVVISQPTAPRPPPLKSTGKMPKPTPAPPAAMKVPGIIATQAFFPALGSPSGTVGLSWDGGPDHPYAEVWVKVNNGPETFVVEQSKGGRQITVQRGTLYEYILTDAGTTLATVRFLAN